MYDIQEIKNRISCLDYAAGAGLRVSHAGARCVSPLRPEAKNKSSFVIFEDFWYDHGVGAGGDVIDLCALLEHGGDRRAAIEQLARMTGVTGESQGDWKMETQRLCGLVQRWHEDLRPEDRVYLSSRGISEKTVNELKIGYTGSGEADDYCYGRLSIPYFKNGYAYSYVARARVEDQEPKYLKRRNDGLSDASAPWGMNTLNRDGPLIIAEGAFDALSFYQEGYPVLATMGGHFSKSQLATVISAAREKGSAVLTFDADDAGREFTKKLGRELFYAGVPFTVTGLPKGCKDVSDYYAGGGDPAQLVETACDGAGLLFASVDDREEFKRMAGYAAGRFEAPELALLFREARLAGLLEPEWLDAVAKECGKSPSEDRVARAVMAEHRLKYLESVGFFEYKRGVWERLDDTRVMGYIGKKLGRFRTGSRAGSIIKLLRADALTAEPFDRAPVFNFQNGTLELGERPLFREHRESDLCSVKAAYPYDPQAECPLWRGFIEAVTGGDGLKSRLLQEIAGYVLFPDNSLERLFVLQGNGGNGKSVYLNTFQAVYGRENTSSVTATGLCDNFQRVYLSESLLNIASEIRSNLAGSEEYLKQIASGETITACYKGQNFIQFKPRCKLIFATNGRLSTGDTSDGLMRRMTIVTFDRTFSDNPAPGQLKRDTSLGQRLEAELSGIFNWCLEGYLTLRRTLRFTELPDEKAVKQELMEASNPLIVFLRDCQPQGRVSKAELYSRYCGWCAEAGHRQGSRTYFIRELKKILPEGTREIYGHENGKPFNGFIFPVESCADVEQMI